MKHLWTTAAAVAIASLLATGAEAATHKKTESEASKSLRDGRKAKASSSKSKKADAAEETRKGGKSAKGKSGKQAKADADETAGKSKKAKGKKQAAADEDAAPSKSKSRSKSAKADIIEGPVTGVVAKGPVKTDGGSPIKVGKGDTLTEVAKKSGVDRETLISLNKLKAPYHLKPGQTLKVPERRYYSVQSGDTLYAVSRRFKVPVDELASFNDVTTKTRVKLGQKIYIPEDGMDQAKPAKPSKLAKAEPKTPAKAAKAAPEQVASSGATTRTRPEPPKPAATTQMAMARTPAPATVAPQPAPSMAVPVPSTTTPVPPAAAPTLNPETGLQPPISAEAGLQPPLNPETGLAPQRAPTPPPVAAQPTPAPSPAAPEPAPAQAMAAATPPPAYVAPQPTYVAPAPTPRPAITAAPPATTAVASATRQPPAALQPRSGFEMAPARPPAPTPRAQSSLPAQGVPYASLHQPSPARDRQGRPTALPPSVAQEAPSSQPPVMVASAPVTQADIVAAGRGRFIWPVKGEILSNFGPKTTGQRNDGLNIAARNGEAVRAAASGKVVYAGDQVPTFGNLVLLQHPNGWVTAYAHMQGITVQNNQMVNQGQQIGVAGASGQVGQTQLHFEMRYAPSARDKAAPVDPMLVLPSS